MGCFYCRNCSLGMAYIIKYYDFYRRLEDPKECITGLFNTGFYFIKAEKTNITKTCLPISSFTFSLIFTLGMCNTRYTPLTRDARYKVILQNWTDKSGHLQ